MELDRRQRGAELTAATSAAARAARLETPGGPAVLPVADAGDGRSADAHRFADEAAAREAAAAIRAAGAARVVSVRSEPGVRRAHPPFTTSSLQQAASARLKLTVARTMELAQRLYEAGAITYMRTDAVALSAEAERGPRSQVEATYGSEYVADPPNRFKAAGGAQRPTRRSGRRRSAPRTAPRSTVTRPVSTSWSAAARCRARWPRPGSAAAAWRRRPAGGVSPSPGSPSCSPDSRPRGLPTARTRPCCCSRRGRSSGSATSPSRPGAPGLLSGSRRRPWSASSTGAASAVDLRANHRRAA